ncbi:MAG TPA: methylmalonyl-CoA mutase family protein, partial [Afifellaceae bacterium]|nr:methylmalonyl-CoA mutase family protein [Afifellaceae bacterium]
MTAPCTLPDFAAMPFQRPGPDPAPSDITWRATIADDGATAEVATETPEGIALKPVYRESDIAGLDFVDGWPGLPPFARGPYPTMYVQ